jgi:catechol 2,3-dioxygenase-like lactoylglutathione lyase family enzyme
MNINHMNLVVPDVPLTAAFFEKHLGFRCTKLMGEIIAILEGENGFVLIISNFPKTATFEYPADFHIGFYQDTREEVTDLFHRLKADGLLLTQEPQAIRDRFGFYFYIPGNILTEITCPAD